MGTGFDIAIGKKCVKHVFIITTGVMSLLLLLPLLLTLLFYWSLFVLFLRPCIYIQNEIKQKQILLGPCPSGLNFSKL